MGGLAAVLGGAAAGFSQAAEADRERQFRQEESRRSQIGTWLGKLASDETAHPASRQAAVQEMLALHQAPFGKPYKFDIDKIIAPAEPPQTQTSVTGGGDVAGAQHQLSVPTPPVGMVGPQQDTAATVQGASHPTLPLTAELTKPGVPAGIFMSPEEVTQMHATRAGAVSSAQAGAQMASPIYQAQPGGGYGAVPVSHAGKIMGPAIPNAVPPLAMSGRNLHPVVIADPATGLPTPAVQDKLTNEIIGQDGQVIPNAQVFSAAMVPKTTSSSTTTPGGLTTTNKKTTTAQPRGAGGKGAKEDGLRPHGALLGVQPPPAVEAEMDNINMFGVPQGKLNDAQALALKGLKQQGIVPEPMATGKARGQADVARQIDPLIQRARELIRKDPNALGPLAGRWSELAQKTGSLKGSPKELAGTLTSIYSLAGSLHGWRSMKVAEEFRKAYGDLSNTPESLTAGLNAMQGTVDAIKKVGYPGMDKTAPSGYVRIKASDGSMHDIPSDKIDAAKQRDPQLQVIH